MDDDSNSYEYRLINVENAVAAVTRKMLNIETNLFRTNVIAGIALAGLFLANFGSSVILSQRIADLKSWTQTTHAATVESMNINDDVFASECRYIRKDIQRIEERLRHWGIFNETDEPPLAQKEKP